MTTKGAEMSKDLLVLADQYAAATATFARALALKDEADSMSPIAREAGDKRAVLAEALAALDTAQPEQVNAMLLEALEAAEKLEHAALVALSEATYELKVGNTYTTATDTYKANNDLIHRLDKILNLQYRDRKREARLAARQAQPARPINCGTGHCSCIECPYEQAQPERAPSEDKRLLRLQEAVIEMYCDWKKGDFALPRLAQLDLEACFEAANCGEIFAAIKQGGQQ